MGLGVLSETPLRLFFSPSKFLPRNLHHTWQEPLPDLAGTSVIPDRNLCQTWKEPLCDKISAEFISISRHMVYPLPPQCMFLCKSLSDNCMQVLPLRSHFEGTIKCLLAETSTIWKFIKERNIECLLWLCFIHWICVIGAHWVMFMIVSHSPNTSDTILVTLFWYFIRSLQS